MPLDPLAADSAQDHPSSVHRPPLCHSLPPPSASPSAAAAPTQAASLLSPFSAQPWLRLLPFGPFEVDRHSAKTSRVRLIAHPLLQATDIPPPFRPLLLTNLLPPAFPRVWPDIPATGSPEWIRPVQQRKTRRDDEKGALARSTTTKQPTKLIRRRERHCLLLLFLQLHV